ncbi:MAG: hypothetical protein ACTHLO_03900 [Pseudolabrys sp.]
MPHVRKNTAAIVATVAVSIASLELPLEASARNGHSNTGSQIKISHPIVVTRSKAAGKPTREHDARTKSDAKPTDAGKTRAQAAPPAASVHATPTAAVADSGGLLKPVVTPSNSTGAAKYFDVYKDDARVIGHYVAAGAHEVASVAKASASTAASAAKSVYHFIGGLF